MKWLLLIAITSVAILSIFVYHLIEYLKKFEGFTLQQEIPKIIWTYWHEEKLPDIIQKCIATWKQHNPTYEINILNDKNLSKYLPDISFDKYKFATTHQRKSDMIRLNILAKYGGVWSDASIIMNKSLDDLFVNKTAEFIGYYIELFTTNHDYPVIENWFFACKPNTKFINTWRDVFLTINNYETVEEYVAHMKINTDFQNIDDPNYLSMHIAAQYVLQNMMSIDEIKSRLLLQKAEDGPFKYLVDNNWQTEQSIDSLCNSRSDDIIFDKLRGIERGFIENNPDKYKCLFEKLAKQAPF
jgi:hypothetical protein